MPQGGKQATRSIRTLLVGGAPEGLEATKTALEKADGKNSVAAMTLTRGTIRALRFGEYDCGVLCCHISKPGAEELAKKVGGCGGCLSSSTLRRRTATPSYPPSRWG